MAVTGDKLRSEVKRNLGFGVTAAEDLLVDRAMCRMRYMGYVATNVAGATFALVLTNDVGTQFLVDSVKVIPSAAVTASDSVYATLTLSYDDGAGGSKTTVAVQTTKITGGSGDWVAEVGVPITITAANALVPSGKQLTMSKAFASTGTVIPAGSLVIVEGYWV